MNQFFTLIFPIAFFLLTISMVQAQFNPMCRGKRYMCDLQDAIEDPDVCMYINDTKNKLHLIQGCRDPAFPICDYSNISYGNPAYCIAKPPRAKTLPGESCRSDSDCHSNRCVSRRCQGNGYNQTCTSDHHCSSGMFCSTEERCAYQQLFGQVSFFPHFQV